MFDVVTGVLQGDVLAPFLFIIVLDWVIRNSNLDPVGFTTITRRSRRHPEERLSDLGYADDISLLANQASDAQIQIDTISSTAAEVGLTINPDKTKILALNMPSPSVTIQNEQLEVVEDFKYLGSYINSAEHDLKCRKGKAWAAFWLLKKIWTSDIPLQTKIGLFDASVLSVLLYGSPTWVISDPMAAKINAFQTSCLRIMLDIKRTDRVKNEDIYALTNLQPLTLSVQERQLRFLGHSIRRPREHPVSRYALYHPNHGRRNRGRGKELYHQYIAKIVNPTFTMSADEIRRAASDREGWRTTVAACRR